MFCTTYANRTFRGYDPDSSWTPGCAGSPDEEAVYLSRRPRYDEDAEAAYGDYLYDAMCEDRICGGLW